MTTTQTRFHPRQAPVSVRDPMLQAHPVFHPTPTTPTAPAARASATVSPAPVTALSSTAVALAAATRTRTRVVHLLKTSMFPAPPAAKESLSAIRWLQRQCMEAPSRAFQAHFANSVLVADPRLARHNHKRLPISFLGRLDRCFCDTRKNLDRSPPSS